MKDIPRKDLMKLLNQVSLGDNKAVETIYRHYQAALYAFIRLRIRDEAAAEEILNDTFMIAFRKAHQYNGTSEFKTWLCGIAKNVCGTWIRKSNSGIANSTVQVDEEILHGFADPDWDILSKLESQQIDHIVRECIDQLPVPHKEAFFWAWFEEESVDTVAERLQCPVGTVKSRLFNARSKIADCVKNVVAAGMRYV